MKNRPPFFAWATTLIVLLGLTGAAFASPEGNWEHLKEKDGIHTWKLEIPGQDLPGFKGETTIAASIDDIMKTMLNWREHTQWMYRCVDSTLVKRIDDNNALMYNRTGAPWPVSDRDVVLQSVIERSADGKELMLTFTNIASELKPPVDGVVRMPRLVGFYKMSESAPGKTKITYQVEADIGGSIPKWLANLASQDLPYKTLSKLRERVQGQVSVASAK